MEPTTPLTDPVAQSHRVIPAAWFLVALGAILRVVRFATIQPLWGDEGYLAASLVDRGFADLLRPLEYHQVAPPLFMAAEWAVVRALGFSEWSLRLVPLLGGLASLPLALLAGRLALGRRAGLLAVAVLAVSFYPIRFATEVKPYATDLMVALGLLCLALAWFRRVGARPHRWLWVLAAVQPLALGLSYPAVFVAGGIAAWLACQWTSRRESRGPILVVLILLATTALGLLVLVIRPGMESAGAGTFDYWAGAFPPWGDPVDLALWLVEAHTSHMFAYPVGGARGASVVTTLLVLVGLRTLWRHGQHAIVGLLLAPFGFGLVATFLGQYPYGGSTRTMQYLAPSIVMLAAAGLAGWFERRRQGAALARRVQVALGVLAAIGITSAVIDVARPYKFPEDQASRAFAKRFWHEESQNAVLVCPRLDLGLLLGRDRHWKTGRTAIYLCHQAAQFERRREGRPPPWHEVGPDRPLRCVTFNARPDEPSVARWLAAMADHGFVLQSHRVRIGVPLRQVGGLDYEDRYDVFDFVPQHPSTATRVARAAEAARLR